MKAGLVLSVIGSLVMLALYVEWPAHPRLIFTLLCVYIAFCGVFFWRK